jgi:hypothetical protein
VLLTESHLKTFRFRGVNRAGVFLAIRLGAAVARNDLGVNDAATRGVTMQKYIIKFDGYEAEELDRKVALARANALVSEGHSGVKVIQQTFIEVEIPLQAETPPAMPKE